MAYMTQKKAEQLLENHWFFGKDKQFWIDARAMWGTWNILKIVKAEPTCRGIMANGKSRLINLDERTKIITIKI